MAVLLGPRTGRRVGNFGKTNRGGLSQYQKSTLVSSPGKGNKNESSRASTGRAKELGMNIELSVVVTVLSAAVTIGTVISLDRRRARAEGAKDQQFEDMRATVSKLEDMRATVSKLDDMRQTVSSHGREITALKEHCITWSDHEADSVKCRKAIFDKVTDVSVRQDEMDHSRDKAREEDQRWKDTDQRWKTNILVYLGRIANKLEIPPINHEA